MIQYVVKGGPDCIRGPGSIVSGIQQNPRGGEAALALTTNNERMTYRFYEFHHFL